MRHVILVPDEDGVGFTAEVPSLPGCISEGDTLEETLENIREAIALYIESMKAHGEPVPEDRPIQVVKV
ncbi:MAG: type II toxin-antitoxin system HicB family antitoxin [Anaerolineae bacterium]|nr:type II toxin-antitoxin system HicB family antitoxin [Anaerolineae bacterium]